VETVQAIGIGNCQIASGEQVNLIWHDSLYVSNIQLNCLSVSKLAEPGSGSVSSSCAC
jgi:hypothetical protein